MLVDYLKILFAFHLALYHLKIMKLLPAMIRGDRAAAGGSFFLDVTGLPDSGAVRLAEVSAAAWYGRIPEFVRATFTVKKLDGLAEHLARRGQLSRPPGGFFAVSDLLGLLGAAPSQGAHHLRCRAADRDRGQPALR